MNNPPFETFETSKPETIRQFVLQQADSLTHGQRNKQHGSPDTNHDNIARIWSVILGFEVQPYQVALCMAGLKLARLSTNPAVVDSYIDGAAYLAIAAELVPENNEL